MAHRCPPLLKPPMDCLKPQRAAAAVAPPSTASGAPCLWPAVASSLCASPKAATGTCPRPDAWRVERMEWKPMSLTFMHTDDIKS